MQLTFGTKISHFVAGFQSCYILLEIFSDKLPYTMVEGEADEIYWVNKLLAIEDMDWSCQLSQAVSILLPSQNLHFQKILNLVTFPHNL